MVTRNESGFPDYPTCLRARLPGGRLVGTDGSMWLYRAVPLNPVLDASSAAEGLAAGDPLFSAFEELASITSVGMARRSTAKGGYRQVHLLLVNVPMAYRPPAGHPLAEYLAASYANESMDRRVLLFGVQLRWLPVGGVGTGPGEPLRSLVLPALTVALGMAPPLVRALREQLVEVLDADFVVTLRAARLPSWRVQAHVLRNAAVPTVSMLGLNIAYLIGGTLVVEKVFALNGLGALLFSSISSRDFPVVQGIALVLALAVVGVSLLTDGLVALLDPRVRTA